MESHQCLVFPVDADLPPCDSRVAELHSYWRGISPAPGVLPGRQHFDPLAVPRLLPWLFLIDVARDPLRFKYRLIGTVHVDATGGWNATGLWLDQVHPRFVGSTAFPQFCAVAEGGSFAYYSGLPTYVIKKDYVSIERLLMPLARNGRDVDMLLGITVLHSASDIAERAEDAAASAGLPVLHPA